MSSSTKIQLHPPQDGVALIELTNPDANNAFEANTLDDLSSAMDAAIADASVRAIVIAGQGRHFSRGASPNLLGTLRDAGPIDVLSNVYSTAQGAMRRVYSCPKPTVAAVHGAAVTIGCELAVACDFRVIDPSATFHEAWIKFGLLPPLGGMFLLPRLIGAARASEMILQGRKVRAEEALQIGLANELVPVERLRGRAMELAAELAALPPHGYRLAKLAFHRAMESSMEIEWTANALAQSILMSTDDFTEGIAAVREGRSPSFIGH